MRFVSQLETYKLFLVKNEGQYHVVCQTDNKKLLVTDWHTTRHTWTIEELIDQILIYGDEFFETLVLENETAFGTVVFDFIGCDDFLRKGLDCFPEWFL